MQLQELIVPLILDTTKYDKGIDSAKDKTVSLKGELSGIVSSIAPTIGLATAVAAVGNAMADAVKETMVYANEVKEVSLVSGATAEESSRLIQVLDDYGVTADGITKASKALAQQGLAPTINTIINLSAQYQSLSTAQERNSFITQNLGKDTANWHNVLSKGPELLRQLNAAVSEGLILTEKQIQQVREAEIAMDNWDDTMKEVKTTFAIELMPAITKTTNAILTMAEAQKTQVKWWERLIPAVASIHTLYIGLTNSEKNAATTAQAQAEALGKVATQANGANQALQGLNKTTDEYWHKSGGTNHGSVRYTYGNRASGGPVIAGQAYNVAEFYQPEVFTPSTSGRIDKMNSSSGIVEARIDEAKLVRMMVSAFQQAGASW